MIMMTVTRNMRARALALLAVCVTGCLKTRPKAPLPAESLFKQMSADLSAPGLLARYNAMPQDTDDDKAMKVARRNQILNEFIALVDRNYDSFENVFYGTRALYNVGADAANLGLTTVATMTGSEHLKTVLSAIATVTTGLKAS